MINYANSTKNSGKSLTRASRSSSRPQVLIHRKKLKRRTLSVSKRSASKSNRILRTLNSNRVRHTKTWLTKKRASWRSCRHMRISLKPGWRMTLQRKLLKQSRVRNVLQASLIVCIKCLLVRQTRHSMSWKKIKKHFWSRSRWTKSTVKSLS